MPPKKPESRIRKVSKNRDRISELQEKMPVPTTMDQYKPVIRAPHVNCKVSRIQLFVGVVVESDDIVKWCNHHALSLNDCSTENEKKRAFHLLADRLSENGLFSLITLSDNQYDKLYIVFDDEQNSFGTCIIVERSEYEDEFSKIQTIMDVPFVVAMNLCVMNYMEVNNKIKLLQDCK